VHQMLTTVVVLSLLRLPGGAAHTLARGLFACPLAFVALVAVL
jgi:hypothetical protein